MSKDLDPSCKDDAWCSVHETVRQVIILRRTDDCVHRPGNLTTVVCFLATDNSC